LGKTLLHSLLIPRTVSVNGEPRTGGCYAVITTMASGGVIY
jgi:hypothetical protein